MRVGKRSSAWRGGELSAGEIAELERIVREEPLHMARRARIILANAQGFSISAIARQVGVHRDSVRRSLRRFGERGLAAVQHGNTGKPKNVVFDAATRAEIRRRASLAPLVLGETFSKWSLVKLRDHLIQRGVVASISHEGLRLVLRERPYSRRHWSPLRAVKRNSVATQVRQPTGSTARAVAKPSEG